MLLDTSALIWFKRGEELSRSGKQAIADGFDAGRLHVSAVSAWEIGNLVRLRRLVLGVSASDWFEEATADPKIRVLALDPATALASTELPEPFHRDPADRFLVATARRLGIAIVTRDRNILAYAQAGHVRAVAC